MIRLRIALGITLVGLLISLVGIGIGVYQSNFADPAVVQDYTLAFNMATIGWGISLFAYLFGGLWTAIKVAGRIAKWGWFILPFPYDLISFPFSFLIAIYVLIFLPIIPIVIAYRENC